MMRDRISTQQLANARRVSHAIKVRGMLFCPHERDAILSS
jgi:hypothetical protein